MARSPFNCVHPSRHQEAKRDPTRSRPGLVTFGRFRPIGIAGGWRSPRAVCDNPGPMDPARRTAVTATLARLADGDRSAFDALMTELWPVVLAFAKRTLREAADAEDVAQEVFIKVASRIADYDRSRDGLTWVYAIATFEIRTQLRRLQRRRELPPPAVNAEPADPMPTHIDLLIDEEMSTALTDALGELTDADRALLGIGEGTGDATLTGATIRKRRQRALTKLRTVWSKLYG